MCAGRTALVLVAVVALAGCAQGASTPGDTAVVARVADGDTIELDGGDRVRLLQIDAPALGDGECYAEEALRELEALAPPGTRAPLERDSALDDVDGYDRLLRYLIVDGENVNLELVRRGAAAPYFHDGVRGRYADDLLAAVEQARTERRGMWEVCSVAWRPDRQVDTFER